MKVSEHVLSNRNAMAQESPEPEWMEHAFGGYLVCNEASCKEQIAVAGKLTLSEGWIPANASEGDYQSEILKTCIPEYFERPPELIFLEDYVPKEVTGLLRQSFGLYWHDEQSCANRIRTSVERILDLFDVKRYPRKGPRIPLSLQTRINDFAKTRPAVADKLTAIKWIGNAGSHVGTIKRSDLLDGYRIMQYALRLLFSKEASEVNKIAKHINKRKRPRSHSRGTA